MNKVVEWKHALLYLWISMLTIIALQPAIIIVHEFTHSTMAWLLSAMDSPLGIRWGNPLTMTGWDEGVDYGQLFAEGHNLRAAVIAFSPLIMHSIVVGVSLYFLNADKIHLQKWTTHVVYWLVVVNLMELVAYIFMRAFAGYGDIGRFNEGLDLSPWWVFVIGSSLLVWVLRLFYDISMPKLQDCFAGENNICRWSVLALTSFTIFLWGSGIRVMFYVSGPQSLFGALGVPLFILTLYLFNPGRVKSTGSKTDN